METRICKFCGKEFQCKESSRQKFCCRQCADLSRRGTKVTKKEKVKVKCAFCGKEEYVTPSRAEKYVCCSVKCLSQYNSIKYSKKITCICPICGKEFKLKPYRYNKDKNKCCSTECSNKYRSIWFSGEGNHQFGLKGKLNKSFINKDLPKKNTSVTDIFVYDESSPDNIDNKYTYGRVKMHRKLVYDNKNLFDKCFFDEKGVLLNGIQVHHIDCNHDNNIIENVIPLTRKEHTRLHNNLKSLKSKLASSIIGVLKQGELLESQVVDNQQPSLYGNIFEGSETNSRVLLDSNTDTSALLQQIINLVNEDIVQTRNITKEAYKASIKEILESEVKSSEENTQRIIEEK